jgi:nucleotide-binding universal stress UspA family protein
MKSVLLYINDDPGLEARLQAALDLTRSLKGHLHCLRASPDHPQTAFAGMAGTSVTFDLRNYVQELNQKLRAFIEERLTDEDVTWNYEQANADPARGLARNSALADIMVLSSASGDKDNSISLGILGDVLFNSRVPVIVQPNNVKKFDATGPVVVAWNGSLEASHALRSAVPLLKMAEEVHILTVEEPDKDHDLPSLAASEYLSRHGILSEVHAPTISKSTVQAGLLSSVDTLNASYIVMGAYGHSKAREFLFGGVTRSLFRDCPVPLVVSH